MGLPVAPALRVGRAVYNFRVYGQLRERHHCPRATQPHLK